MRTSAKRNYINQYRNLLAILFLFVSLFSVSISIYAEDSDSTNENIILLEDEANLLTPDQREDLTNRMLEINENLDDEIAMAIFTTTNLNGLEDRDFGDPRFEQILDNENIEDGFYLLISVEPADRVYYIGTFGFVIDAITDQRIDNILDAMYEPMVDGDYYNALNIGLNRASDYVIQGAPANQYREAEKELGASQITTGVLISGGIAAVAAWISSASHKRKIRGDYDAIEQKPVYNFAKETIAEYSQFENKVINTRRVVTPIVRSSYSSSRGGSSGRSTTHRTGGGRSSGGGGRKF